MSHNKIKVGGQSPNTSGEISVALNDLSDVSGSPSTSEALVYGGSGWAPGTLSGELQTIFIAHRAASTSQGDYDAATANPSLTTAQKGDLYRVSVSGTLAGVSLAVNDYIFFTQNSANPVTSAYFDVISYSGSPASAMTTNSTFYVYDSAPYNTITGSTINQTNGWVDYITLPAGKYTIQSQVRAEFSASTGYLGTVWKNSANNVQYSAEGFVGDLSSFGGPTAEALGHLDISVNTDIYLKIGQVSSIHAIASQSTTPAEYSAVVILKLE